ncbi:MAG: hypothetical protein H6737_21310 [Alphaproteobacteria bacterium]|nr:hypothetical protein [Alphaproteobacteria bacterium]
MIPLLLAGCGTAPPPPPVEPAPEPAPAEWPALRVWRDDERLRFAADGRTAEAPLPRGVDVATAVFEPGTGERWVATFVADSSRAESRIQRLGAEGVETLWPQATAGIGMAGNAFVSVVDLDADGVVEVVRHVVRPTDVGADESFAVWAWDGKGLAARADLVEAAKRYETLADQQMSVLAGAVGLYEVHQRASAALYATEVNADLARERLDATLTLELPDEVHLVTLPKGPEARLVVTHRDAKGHAAVFQLPIGPIDIALDPACLPGTPLYGLRTVDWGRTPRDRAVVIEHLDGTERVARIAHWDGESLALLPDAFALGSCTADPSPVRVEAYADADPKVAIGRFLLLRGGH